MFDDDIEMGEVIEETPSSESEQQFDTADEADGNVADTQNTEQGDIQDTTSTPKTVPIDVVETMRREMQELKNSNQFLQNLFLKGQPQQKQPEPDPLSQIDPDTVLTAREVLAILEHHEKAKATKAAQEAYSAKENALIEAESTFTQSNPDYNDVISVIPKGVAQSLYNSYSNVNDLVAAAYKIGKALKGEAVTTPNTVKAKVDVENKLNQNLNQPKTLSQVKGTNVSLDNEKDFDAWFNKL